MPFIPKSYLEMLTEIDHRQEFAAQTTGNHDVKESLGPLSKRSGQTVRGPLKTAPHF